MAVFRIKRFSKQKEFTRAEKAAFRGMYRKMYVPKGGAGNLRLPRTSNPRDVERFNQLGIDLANLVRGDKKGFNKENAKILLTNAGMPKMAGQIDRLVDKYTNKRALVRLRRLKDRNPNWGVSSSNIPREGRLNKSIETAKRNNKETAQSLIDQTSVPRDREVMLEVMKTSRRDFNSPVKSSGGDLSENHFLPNYKVIAIDNPKSPWGKDYRIKITGDGGKVSLGYTANEAIAAHEVGHAKSVLKSPTSEAIQESLPKRGTFGEFKTPLEYKRRMSKGRTILRDANESFGKLSQGIETLAQENSANSYGSSILNKAFKKVHPGQPIPEHYKQAWEGNQGSYTSGILGEHFKDILEKRNKWKK